MSRQTAVGRQSAVVRSMDSGFRIPDSGFLALTPDS
jgi:hypothetical protein